MRYIFSYKTKKLEAQKTTLRPYAEVQLDVRGRLTPFDFLVDSGADRTVINYSLGRALGFNLQTEESSLKIGGVGGTTAGRLRMLDLWIGEVKILTEVIWIQSDHVPLLLGQKDVFDTFNITFSKSAQQVIFSLVEGKPGDTNDETS